MNEKFFEEIEKVERSGDIKPWFAVNVRSELLERDSMIVVLMEQMWKINGESEVQRGFFNAAMDRAEKAEAENERLKVIIAALGGNPEVEP